LLVNRYVTSSNTELMTDHGLRL